QPGLLAGTESALRKTGGGGVFLRAARGAAMGFRSVFTKTMEGSFTGPSGSTNKKGGTKERPEGLETLFSGASSRMGKVTPRERAKSRVAEALSCETPRKVTLSDW